MGYGKITKEEAERRQRLLQQGIKVCSHCKRELPVSMFYKDSTTKDKLASFCKDCKKERELNRKDKRQKWRDEHREELREKYRSAEYKEKRKQYRESHKEEEKVRRKYYDTTVRGRYGIYKQNAKQRNIEFDLTLDEFDNITRQSCVFCGQFNGECNGVKYSGVS